MISKSFVNGLVPLSRLVFVWKLMVGQRWNTLDSVFERIGFRVIDYRSTRHRKFRFEMSSAWCWVATKFQLIESIRETRASAMIR